MSIKRTFSNIDNNSLDMASVPTSDLDALALNRFSRQNAALGAETTAKLTKMKIIVVGMRGVGVETAKNLLLQGVGGVTLVDSNECAVQDMGVNFFINEDDVSAKKARAEAVAPKLQELNNTCKVTTAAALTEELVGTHSALVVTDKTMTLSSLLYWDNFCRSSKVSFAYCFTGGVSVSMFVDHGSEHVLHDPNGEKPVQKLISNITKVPVSADGKSGGYLLVRYESPEGQPQTAISEGFYTITDVQGITHLNGRTYEVTHPYSDPVKTIRVLLEREASSPVGSATAALDFLEGEYFSGGLLTEKKVPVKFPMLSLAEKIKSPGNAFDSPPSLVLTDMINFGAELQQHVAWLATLVHAGGPAADVNSAAPPITQFGTNMPRVNNAEDAAAVLQVAKDLISQGVVDIPDFDLDEASLLRFVRYAGVELQPLSAFAGGVLAQEIVKITGKFTPIPGFLHFAALESLPNADQSSSAENADAANFAPRNSRYDEIACVYGWNFVEKLGKLKYFMVGCGALGCEFMKNFALNGICCGEGGKLYVTDADRIELSNLSRQFLFREHNVGQPKSRAAAVMATVMNKGFTVEALEIFVGTKTENVFNDEFWTSLDGVCNALDNMESRIYVDTMCVKYEKSLLESGTMGTSCNVDTICPFKTRTYRDGGAAAETGGVPMCTLRNFPHLTDHCIEWSRDQFELLFTKLTKTCTSYAANPLLFEEEKTTLGESELGAAVFDIRAVLSYFKAAASPSVGAAAQLAFDLFHFLFRDKIMDLQGAFPPDARMVDPKTGADKGPFWSEKKRYPTAAVFNPDDEAHWTFMQSATCLFGVALGVLPAKQEDDDSWLSSFRSKEWIVGLCQNLTIPPYIPVKMSAASLGDAPEGEKSADDNDTSHADKMQRAAILDELLLELRTVASRVKLPAEETQDFEKDDDYNFHIAFITAASNLRCDNYTITRTDFHACKVIAGKIIAAIATTTAAACGLVILELFKLLLGKDTEAFMNRQIALAVNAYTSFTQEPPVKFSTVTESIQPSPEDPDVPPEAFDATGKVLPEYVVKKVKRAYPENHSVWDKLNGVTSDMTLRQFVDWFENEHKLKMTSWNFVFGSKKVTSEGETKSQNVSAPVYPPKVVLNYALLPPLDMSMAQATGAIMRNKDAKPTQQYIALWKQCKAEGALPSEEEIAAMNKVAITEQSTLYEVLSHMATLAAEGEAEGKIDNRAITNLEGRKMWVIPSSETPSCRDIETGDDIDHMAAIKIDIVQPLA